MEKIYLFLYFEKSELVAFQLLRQNYIKLNIFLNL